MERAKLGSDDHKKTIQRIGKLFTAQERSIQAERKTSLCSLEEVCLKEREVGIRRNTKKDCFLAFKTLSAKVKMF